MGAGFTHLAPTLPALARRIAHEPLAVARAVIFPLSNLRSLWELLASGGGLYFLSPLELMVWAVNFIPHLLSEGYYHDLRLHYSAYVMGPFWWATVLGLVRAQLWLAGKNKAYLLVVFSLLLGSYNLSRQSTVLLQGWNKTLFGEAPEILPLIPDEASVWAHEFISPRVACRPYVWAMLPGSDFATPGLFVPDYVLLVREYVVTTPPFKGQAESRERLMTFLAREKYSKVAERSSLILLRHPRAPLAQSGGRPPLFVAPTPDPQAAAAYALMLARNDSSAETTRLLRSLAERDDAESQYNLGVAYSLGQGVAPDADEAIKWWTLAAEQGMADAKNNLGSHYAQRGDWANAAKFFQGAAEQGVPDAEKNLGVLYTRGLGVPQNDQEGLRWLMKAAGHGSADAQTELGAMYAGGHGVAKDIEEGLRWWMKAAGQGYPKAETNLGTYAASRGDWLDAVSWFRKAAARGYGPAQLSLGLCLIKAPPPIRSVDEAVFWLRKAAAQGSQDARTVLKQLAR